MKCAATIRFLLASVLITLFSSLQGQGNKLSIQATIPKALTVCGVNDTARVTAFNISSSVLTGVTVTLNLPSGVRYIAGSVSGTGISENNISNLNKPVFNAPTLLIGRNFTFRYRISADCDIIAQLSGNNTPQINVRVDYSGNYDVGSSNPFVPALPSPGFNTITNQSYTGNVGDKFIRRITITNYGKGPLYGFRLLRLKGKDLSLKSETGFGHRYNGDSVITTLTKADFTKIGNKDSIFDQNESIAFSDTFTINGCNSLNTQLELVWGCNGKWCQVVKNNALASISSQSPNLQVTVSSSLVSVYNGTQASRMTMRIVNIGQMKATRVSAIVFQTYNPGAGFANSLISRIDSSSLYLKRGWKGTAARVYSDTFLANSASPCWSAGSMGGFRIRPADMAPSDTLWITWDVLRCANQNCNTGFYELGWGYRVSYQNQCKTVLSTNDQWGNGYTYSGGSVTTWTPTDIMPGDVKNFRYTFAGMGNVPLDATARIRIDVILPVTLTHSRTNADFYIDNANLTSIWYPDSIRLIKDTLRGYFGRFLKFGLSNAELTVRLKGVCAGTSSNQVLPVKMNFWYNPNTSAHPTMWIKPVCNTVNVKVHCSNYCKGGMQFRDFELFRSNSGLPDNDNNGLPDVSGKLDSLKVRRERIMVGDTLTAVFMGRPRSASGITNWPYGFAESFITYGDYLSVVDARLEIHKAGKKTTGACNTVRWKKVSSGANATFYFNYSVDSIWRGGCLASTYRYSQNDSMRLIVRYRVSKNIGGASVNMNFSNRYYLSNVAAPTTAQSYQCDTFSGSCILYGYYFHNYGPDFINYSNCAETWIGQNFYLGIGPCCSNYGGFNAFPFEYRNWARPVAIRLNLPPGLKLNRTRFGQYRTAGSNATAHEMKDTVPARKGTSNPYVFDFVKYFKDSGGAVNYSDDGFHGYFVYSVIPSCSLPAGTTQAITYDYIYEKRGALGKGYDTIRSTIMGTNDAFTFQPPKFVLQPALSTVYANKDTAEWEVRYTNPSTSFSAYNIWLSPGNNANIKVVEIRDAVRDTVIKPVKDIYRAGVLAPNSTRRFKVRAIYNSCNPDSITMYASWNCSGYPADFVSYPCTPNQTKLYLEPQNTRLQVTLTDSASTLDLCAGNKLTLLVENIQSVTAYQVRVRVNLPIGMSIISGSGRGIFPLKSSPVALSNPVLVSGTTWEWDLSKLIAAMSKGLSGTSDTSRNKFFVTFRVKTDCNYASGSFVSARVLSNIKCGDPVPANPAFTNPLEIKGVIRPYYTLVKSWSDSILPCQKPALIKVRVIMLGPNKSGGKDLIEILLPPGMARDTSYWNAVRNAPPKDSVTVSNFSGATLVSWKIPANIVPGDSMEFDVRMTATGNSVVCGPADILVRSVVSQSVVCITTGLPCNIKVITGSTLANPPVDKGNVQLQLPWTSARILSGDTEEVVLKYRLRNTGRYMSSGSPIVVRYHYDANTNGKWDPADPQIGADTIVKALAKDSFVSVQRKLRVKAGRSCGLLALVDSGACACKFGQINFPAPRILNAGNDTAICSGSTWRPGQTSVKGYSYTWDRPDVLDSVNLARPLFTGINSGVQPDTQLLVLTTNRGACTSKDSVRVISYPLPQLTLTSHAADICEKQAVIPDPVATSGTPAYTWKWSPGTGLSDSVSKKPTARPGTTTRYKVTVTDAKKCTAQDTFLVMVHPYPRAGFYWPVTCMGNMLQVTDSTRLSSGSIQTRIWSAPGYDTFGVVSVQLPMFGKSRVPVTLMVQSDKGCADTLTRMVDVKPAPRCSFTAAPVCLGDTSVFINKTTIDSTRITGWSWTFGDGNTSTKAGPRHKYSSAGGYTVKLTATTEYGCVDSASLLVPVHAVPDALFSVPAVCEGDSLRFSNRSNLFGDTVKFWKWNFGTYGMAGTTDPVLFIPGWGTHPVRLTVETNHGCRDSFADSAYVHPLPVPSFTVSPACLGVAQNFSNKTTVPAGTISGYSWSLGDGQASTVKSPVHTYGNSGAHMAVLTVKTDKGCTDSIAGVATVYPPAWPVVQASNHCLRETLSVSATYRGTGTPTTYRWRLGNGDSATGPALTYQYPLPGNYNINLQIVTDMGCVRDTQISVKVHPLPQVNAIIRNPCRDDSLIFTDNSSIAEGSMKPASWRFSDGQSLTGSSFNRIMATPGNYTAVLTRQSLAGCTDSSVNLFTVYPAVRPAFDVNPVCEEETSQFTDKSFSPNVIIAYAWDFGDNTSSTLQHPDHKYRLAGSYAVKLKITTLPGCIYPASGVALVHPKPRAGFATNPDQGTIVNPNIEFTDLSTGADSLWYEISNGYSTRSRNFTFGFPDSGQFTIRQYVNTRFGCRDSFSKNIFIHFMYTLHVPTAFTPNADSRNEVFAPGGMGINWYSMKIYDRWGMMLYETRDSKPWDGRYNGEILPEGVYIVLIEVKDYKGFKHYYRGSLHLLH